jgi:centractin
LFDPSLIGAEFDGVHDVVVSSINKVDMDLRRTLYANIVLSGGTTLCRGKSVGLINLQWVLKVLYFQDLGIAY